jgi:hypothetical protein
MKRLICSSILAIAATVFLHPALGQNRSEAPLTNAAVIKLVRAGFKEKTIVAIIQSRTNTFELGPDRLIELKRNGVSENIILAMLSHDFGTAGSDDGWDDDAFFGRKATKPKSGSDSNSTDIFGSGGGSSSETSKNGVKGGGHDETSTTGSASVRIIRPPSESGGSNLKMEKTPTLTNDSIVQLVEAGFSEGTIIKRIEDSPADFDISPAKLQELRKRRVSEPIIAAMTAAMTDSSTPTNHKPGQEN